MTERFFHKGLFMTEHSAIRFILFDLDGTLFDSAPDLVGAANRLRTRRGLPALPFEEVRTHAGRGARGLIEVTLGLTPDDEGYPAIQKEFLDDYQSHCCDDSHLFDEVDALLNGLEERKIPWGIVTNKHARFTTPIAEQTGMAKKARVIVCGDATGKLKPAPDNLLLALAKTGFKAEETLYVGDDSRDAQAARHAGMRFAAAAYGYLGLANDVTTWQADWILSSPLQILKENQGEF